MLSLLFKKIVTVVLIATILVSICSCSVQPAKTVDPINKSVPPKNQTKLPDAQQEFYSSQSIMTDPGEYAFMYQDLPSDISELCSVVQGLMIHAYSGLAGMVPDKQKKGAELHRVSDMLKLLSEVDTKPLIYERDVDKRILGNCRHFALLLCSILRYQGIPARARCGFATYFTPGMYDEHWLCEYWDTVKGKWIYVDAQLGKVDISVDEFISADRAWQMCRTGNVDANLFGTGDMHGLWFVRGDLVRDAASLFKMELLPWDSWGIINGNDEDILKTDLEFLDGLAGLINDSTTNFDKIKIIYENDKRVNVPDSFLYEVLK